MIEILEIKINDEILSDLFKNASKVHIFLFLYIFYDYLITLQ